MNVQEEISRAWSEHGDQPDAVAARLPVLSAGVRSAEEAAAFTRFALHFVGEERGEWAEAAALCASAIRGAQPAPALAAAEADQAVALLMAGDLAAGLAAEARGVALAGADGLALLARCRLGLATARLASPALQSAPLLLAALALVEAVAGPSAQDRALAVACNNLASALLEQARDESLDAAMALAARLAHRHWLRAGTWLNEARADYLLGLVANALGDPEQARDHAQRGLALLAAHEGAPVDEAFLNLVVARASRALGAADGGALDRADALAAAFDKAWLQSWYAEERAKATGGAS